jgi:hypothetical protein
MKVSEIQHRHYSSYGRGTVRQGYFDESKIFASARSALFDSPTYIHALRETFDPGPIRFRLTLLKRILIILCPNKYAML